MYPIESAAFAAWPALESEYYRGWLLRFANGYTKRANSANATPQAADLNTGDLDQIELGFRHRGLRPIFRLVADLAPPAVDQQLTERGYALVDPSLVMTAVIPALEVSGETRWLTDAAAWLELFQAVSGKMGSGQLQHLRMLRAIAHPCAFAVHYRGERPVCCGLGVLVDNQLGLFDIATHPDCRRQGLSRRLCRDLMAWGHQRGANLAYLQVDGANVAAIALYQRLGFSTAYHYWYRVGPG